MKQHELKAGALLLLAFASILAFAWIVGVNNPLSHRLHLYVTYHFAGGIEIGSPVRVSGIKVGQVDTIEFYAMQKSEVISNKEPGSMQDDKNTAQAPVRLRLSIDPKAAISIRQDSKFYINLAGVIGERYIEITPGHRNKGEIHEGDQLIGTDPPRIDQLLSQSFDLAGKIASLIEDNKDDITHTVELMVKLSTNLNKTLTWVERSELFKSDLGKLVTSLLALSQDLHKMTQKIHGPEGERMMQLLSKLIQRLEPLEQKAILDFFQKEGIRVHLF